MSAELFLDGFAPPEAPDAPAPAPREQPWVSPYALWWRVAIKGEPPFGQLARHLANLHHLHGSAKVLRWLHNYWLSTGVRFFSLARFAATAGSWDEPIAPGRPDWRDPRPGEDADAYIARMTAPRAP